MARDGAGNSVVQRPLGLRARLDLEYYPQRFGEQRSWVVKDPVALRYFQLREEEYTVLRSLDGRASLADIATRFCQRFAPRRVTEVGVHRFLASLHDMGLVVSDHPGQTGPLLERRRRGDRRAMLAAASSLLAIRVPGIDPRCFLRWVYPFVAWIFHPLCIATCLGMMLAALVTVLVNSDELTARLPHAQAFFNPANLPWLAVCLAGVKVLHELGHAMACRRFGCECHEIGLMFLVFTPCLYCDVTDSWTLPNKWQRMTITAAGLYVELLLAAVATFFWWVTVDGLFHSLCLDVMFVCSAGTFLINGNPLLRYDGYYLLADWLEIPNLWQRSRDVLSDGVSRLLLGAPRRAALPEDRPVLLGAYGLLSIAYRWLVALLILTFLYRILRPLELELVAHGITAMTLATMVYGPARSALETSMAPGQPHAGQGRRRTVVVAGLLLVTAAVLIPLPHRVRAPALVEAADAEQVYVTVAGRLLSACEVDDKVGAGETIAVLENDELAMQIETLSAQVDEQAAHVRTLEARRAHDSAAAADLPEAREALESLQSQFEARTTEAQQLTLKASRGGTILPAPAQKSPPAGRLELVSWVGLPTDRCNEGAFLDTGTLLCSIGDPARLRAVVYLNEKDVQLVREGDSVEILLEQDLHTVLRGEVERIDALQLEDVPPRLAVVGTIPGVDEEGRVRPVETCYRAEVKLVDGDSLTIGLRGRSRISVAPLSILQRAVRFLGHTFRRAS